MARLVRHDRTDPVKIDPATWPRDALGNLKNISICACGISATFPFCDGAHKTCRGETPGRLYQYDPLTRAPSDIGPDTIPPGTPAASPIITSPAPSAPPAPPAP